MNYIGFAIVLILSWGLPLYGLINNRLNPSYESALAIPYAFLFGSGIHLISMIIWFVVRRSKLDRSQLIILIASFIIMVVLTVIADSGSLGKF